jgi:hypothetical protein
MLLALPSGFAWMRPKIPHIALLPLNLEDCHTTFFSKLAVSLAPQLLLMQQQHQDELKSIRCGATSSSFP